MLTRFSRSVCRGALVCLLFCVVMAVSTSSASAQMQPAISPWLQMFNNNRNNAGLSNYHTYVAPQQRAIQTFQAQERQIQAQGRQIQAQGAKQRSLQEEIGSGNVLNAPRQIGSIGGAKGAGYRQYLHYYQGLPQGGVPSYATGRR